MAREAEAVRNDETVRYLGAHRHTPRTALDTPPKQGFGSRISRKRVRATLLRCGGRAVVDQHNTNQSNLEARTARELIWTTRQSFQGWTCSQCEWNYPLPTLLTDADARTAYDRLAAGKFRDHKCADHLRRLDRADHESFTPRIRKLVAQGFKPKDAVELFLQEIALEYRNQPKTLAQAKADGEDFLRRVKAGLI